MKVKKGKKISKVEEDRLSSSDSCDDDEDPIKNLREIPRGKPKSGRSWKSERTRARSIVKTRGLQLSLEKKLKLKKDLNYIKSLSREIIGKKNKEKEDRRLRRVDNLKRKEENQKKSEVVQVIKNPLKIKKMKRRHLRMIEKRDTLPFQK